MDSVFVSAHTHTYICIYICVCVCVCMCVSLFRVSVPVESNVKFVSIFCYLLKYLL